MKEQKKADSVITSDMTISGEIHCGGMLRIDGVLSGTLHADGVVLGSGGRFDGDAFLRDCDCRGTMDGTIRAKRLRLRATAQLSGTVDAAELQVDTGATLQARLSTGTGATVTELSQAASPPIRRPVTAALRKGDNGDRKSAEPEPVSGEAGLHADIVDSLITALQGGSRLVVVVSDKPDNRQLFSRTAIEKLSRCYQVLHLAEPAGSVKDVMFRIAGQLGADSIPGQQRTEEVLRAVRDALGTDTGGALSRLIFVENGESMFPATLEGLLRLLADQDTGPGVPLVLTGAAELQKMQEIAPEGASVWEPDCLLVLPE